MFDDAEYKVRDSEKRALWEKLNPQTDGQNLTSYQVDIFGLFDSNPIIAFMFFSLNVS